MIEYLYTATQMIAHTAAELPISERSVCRSPDVRDQGCAETCFVTYAFPLRQY